MPEDKRMPLAKMRELLPRDEEYTDEYLLRLRDDLYGMAELALECYFEKKKSSQGYPL